MWHRFPACVLSHRAMFSNSRHFDHSGASRPFQGVAERQQIVARHEVPWTGVWTFIEGHVGEFSPHRPYGQSVARSGLKSVAQGSPWVVLPTRISPEGATRYGDNWLGTFEPDRVRVFSPFSISNPEDRVFFMERTFMCLVRAKRLFLTNPG
jgi:hypothetical protein